MRPKPEPRATPPPAPASNSGNNREREKKDKVLPEKSLCRGCGNTHFNGKDGPDHKRSWEKHNHPGVNKDSKKSWDHSAAGKAAKAAGYASLRKWAENIDGTPFERVSRPTRQGERNRTPVTETSEPYWPN